VLDLGAEAGDVELGFLAELALAVELDGGGRRGGLGGVVRGGPGLAALGVALVLHLRAGDGRGQHLAGRRRTRGARLTSSIDWVSLSRALSRVRM